MLNFLRQGLEHLPQAVPEGATASCDRRDEPRKTAKSTQKVLPFVLRVCFANSRKPVFAERSGAKAARKIIKCKT